MGRYTVGTQMSYAGLTYYLDQVNEKLSLAQDNLQDLEMDELQSKIVLLTLKRAENRLKALTLDVMNTHNRTNNVVDLFNNPPSMGSKRNE